MSRRGLRQRQADRLHAHFDLRQREAEHRIANALQLLAASLLTQAQATDDRGLAQPLSAAAARVAAIGSLHRHLHETSVGQGIFLDIAEVLRDTARETVHAMLDEGAAQDTVSLEAPPNGLCWPAEHAPAVALAAVELATNAIKHGAKRITLRLAPIGPSPAEESTPTCLLTVDDDGAGFPPGFDPTHGIPGIGLRLVRALAGARGNLETARTPVGGGRVMVRFDFASLD